MISRRSFFQRLLVGAAAFAILPPAETYLRIWRAQRPIIYPVTGISCAEYVQFLVNETPRYDALILKDMLGTDTWLDKVETGIWPGMEENRLLQFMDRPFDLTLCLTK